MQTIGDAPAYYKAEKARFTRLHRRALGHNTTPAQRARYVAESITRRNDAGMFWDWSTYGLAENAPQRALVEAELEARR